MIVLIELCFYWQMWSQISNLTEIPLCLVTLIYNMFLIIQMLSTTTPRILTESVFLICISSKLISLDVHFPSCLGLPNLMYSVLEILIFRWFAPIQFFVMDRNDSTVSLLCSSSSLKFALKVLQAPWSSTYPATHSGKSLISYDNVLTYKLNRIGPSTLPCKSEKLISDFSDSLCFILTLACLCVK